MWNRRLENLDRVELQSLQLARLKEVLARVYNNVPVLKQRLDDNAIGLSQIEKMASVADLANLPFMKKTDLRENYPFGLFALPLNQVTRLHASSGTKGKPTVVAYHRGDTVLETARRGALRPPFSCEAGNCATCMAILREGGARMRANNALTPEEVQEGWILTCQALPEGSTVVVEYEAL